MRNGGVSLPAITAPEHRRLLLELFHFSVSVVWGYVRGAGKGDERADCGSAANGVVGLIE